MYISEASQNAIQLQKEIQEGGKSMRGKQNGIRNKEDDKSSYTVSWRIRIFNCIEEVPRFFFSIEFNPTF
jgi:hypothetical protein